MENDINTVTGQIGLLEELGMVFDDKEKATEILSDIGYYRLGFYWFPFEKMFPQKVNRDHVFKDATRFDTVVRLYYFDFDLRHLLLKYISRIEIHLRTVLINTMSIHYPKASTWFANDKVVAPSYAHSFKKIYDRIFLSPYIKAHHHNHSCQFAPARKTLEFMTLGEIIDLIASISDVNIRMEISHHFGIRSLKTFDSYLNAIRRIRNRCAHGGVLYDYKASIRIASKGPVDLSNVYDRANLKGAVEVIQYLVGIISLNRKNQLEQELQRLIDDCKDDLALYNAICISSGLK